jgi:hypothetical protein
LYWVAVLVGLSIGIVPVLGQEPDGDQELSQHLTTVRSQIENSTIDLDRREEMALEMSATLDRAAQRAQNPLRRRRLWSDAIDLLDAFLKANSDLPRERQLRFQASVLRWAQGRSFLDAAITDASDSSSRREASSAFDDAINRLRQIEGRGNNPTLADNVRFRLAGALADRADLEPARAAERMTREAEALRLLENVPEAPGLAGYWHLLRAELLRRGGKFADAESEVALAYKSSPAPPALELIEVNVPLMIELKRFADALKALDAASLDSQNRAMWMTRIRLAQLANLPKGDVRYGVEVDLFRWIKELRKSNSPERKQGLVDLARGSITLDEREPPEAWEALAEAYSAAGDPLNAGLQMTRAADRALALGQASDAAGYRLKAGAFLFQAGRYLESDTILSRVADDPTAGAPRAKAGMLRTLARARALAAGTPGVQRRSYLLALEGQIRDFPADPVTDEARWLLGQVVVAEGGRERAETYWLAIAPKSPRWLDARLALATLDRELLDRQLINPDRHEMQKLYVRADRFLEAAIPQAPSEAATAELVLARARLNLTPEVGKPELARELSMRAGRIPGDVSVPYRARLFRMVAAAALGRYAEAEREGQTHQSWRVVGEGRAFFDTVRLLDEWASTADSDLRQRRFGLLLKLIVGPLVESSDEKMTSDEQSELAMRLTRALLFTGADRDARRSVTNWRGGPQSTNDRLLRDLGDTYKRLQAYTLDVDVQRLRLKNNAAGSIEWLDARYALALAYYHNGRHKEAAQLIDSTSILHPELGGNALHDKFIHLRQRLGFNE